MKLIFTILLLILMSACFAISEYTCVFLALEPSNTVRALGYGGIGVADIWHNNPLNSYSNPAMASLRDGVSYGRTHENWLGIDNIYYDAGMVNLGFRGLGIILPAPNQGEELGINLDYGMQTQTDAQGNEIGRFRSYESATPYGVAINFLNILRSYNEHYPLLDHIDITLGAEQIFIKSYLGPGIGEFAGVSQTEKAQIINLGCLCSLNYTVSDILKFEGVYGLSMFNPTKSTFSYINSADKDPIYRYNNDGYAVSAALLSSKLLGSFIPDEILFFDNIATVRYFAAKQDDFKSPDDIESYGAEIGLMDTIYLRRGHYDDPSGHITGDTEGIGINLHYKDLIAFTYNTSEIPGGELISRIKSSDQHVFINFLGWYNLLKK